MRSAHKHYHEMAKMYHGIGKIYRRTGLIAQAHVAFVKRKQMIELRKGL